eukprot:c20763_g1_i1 orf=154-2889(+)
MADAAYTRSLAIAASTDPYQPPQARHSHQANPWGTWEELLLASAVQRYGNNNWALISTELQSRTRARFAFTPEACQAKYEAIKLRFGFDETREEGAGTLWFEELRKLRVAHLKQELEQYDNSIGSLEKKIRRLQSEKAISSRDKSLTLGYGTNEPERAPFGACEHGSNAVLVESGFSQTHPDLAKPASGNASVHESVQFNKDFVMVQPNVGPCLLHADSGLTLAKRHSVTANMVQLNAGETPRLDSLSQLNDGEDSASDLQATEESKCQTQGDHCVGVLEGVVHSVQIEGIRDTKDGKAVEVFMKTKKNANGEGCNAAKTDLRTGISRHVCWHGSTKQAEENECLLSEAVGVPATKQSPSLEWADSIDNEHQHVRTVKNECQDPSTSKNGTATQNVSKDSSTSKVKIEMLTAEDAMSEPAMYKLKGGMQTLAAREFGVAISQPAKLDSKRHIAGCTENSPPREVWGESFDTQAELSKRKETFLAGGKIQKLSLSVTEGFDEMRDDVSVPFTPADSSVKSETITTSNETSDSAHASGSSGGNDDNTDTWHNAERLSGDSRVEKSEPGSLVDGNDDSSPMSKRNKREPKIAGKLIPLLDSLRTICAHKCASLFKHSRETQSNRRYYRMIRSPMSLGIIRVKLEEGQYSGSLDFFRDLLLMVSNALVYYAKNSSESAAASGLRECILREMEVIFETEVLVKQEGPTFRKRDTGKARQLPGKPGKVIGAQMLALSTGDLLVKDLALKQCDGSMNVGCAGHQSSNSIRPDEGATTARAITDKKDGSSSDNKRSLERDSNKSRGACGSVASKKASEPGAGGSIKASTIAPEDTIVKERLAESLGNEEWSPPKAKTPKATAGTSSRSVESCSDKIITAHHRTPEPLKRGVGRPPKHSHNQDSQRAKEAYNSPRKKIRR